MALTDNIVAYYTLDENTGTSFADATGNGWGGTLVGSSKPTWTAGKIGSALTGFSAGNYAQPGNMDTALNGATAFTVVAWVNIPSLPFSSSYAGLFSRGYNSGAAARQIVFFGNGSSSLLGAIVNDSSIFTSGTVTTGVHFVALTWDGTLGSGNGKFWFDGAQSGSAFTRAGPLTSTTTFGNTIGNFSNSGLNGWPSWIDEVGIWSRALSSTEIGQLYNSGSGLQYPFSGGGGPAFLAAPNSPILQAVKRASYW